MHMKCLPVLLIITAAAAVVNADSFNSEEDGLKPSLSCILWGDVGCRRKCALLCTAFGCLSSSPQCNTVFCDCREKLPIKCLGVVPNASNSPELPPDVTFRQLLVVKFMRTPVFRDLDKVMPTVPELELEVKKFLYTTDLSGKELKQEMKRRFPSLKHLFRRLRPRPLAQLNPNVSAEVMKEGINVEPEEPPSRSYFSSWLKPKPTKFDVNSPENQKRIINLIKKLPYKHDIAETFEVLRDSPEKPLYQNICRYFLKEGMLSPDGIQIIKPTSDPAELEKKVLNDDVIRQLEDRINESNEQKKNRKRKRVSNSGENSSEENEAKKPKLDQTPGQSPNNGWWSPSMWGPGGTPQNNSGPGQNAPVGPTATDKPSGSWWWGWGNGKDAPKDGGVDKSVMPPPLPSAGQSPNQGPNSGGSWKWPSWNWPAGSGPQGTNIVNPDQPPVLSNPPIGSPWGNDLSSMGTPITSSNSGRSLDSPEPGNSLLKEVPKKKTPKEMNRHKLRKIPDTKDLQEDVFPDMESIDKTLGKPKKKHPKHGKHKKHKKHKKKKHHPESSESDSDSSSSEEISPSHKKKKKHHKKPSENDESSPAEISPTGTPTKHKKRKKHQKKSPDSDDSSSEEITPPGASGKHKKRKKHHKKSSESDDSSSEEPTAPNTTSKDKKNKKHRHKPSDNDESSSEENSPQHIPSKHPKKKHHKKSLDGESPTGVISPGGSLPTPKKKRKHKKNSSDSDESSSEEVTSPGSQLEHETKKKHKKPKKNNDNLKSQVNPDDYFKPEKKKKNSTSEEDDSNGGTAEKMPSIGGSPDQKIKKPMEEISPKRKIDKSKKKKDEPSQANSDESSSEEISPDGTVTKHKSKRRKKNKPSSISSQPQPSFNGKDSNESSPEKLLVDAAKTKHHKKKKVPSSLPSNKQVSTINDSSTENPSSPELASIPKKRKNMSTSSSASISSSQSPDEPSNDNNEFKKPKKTPNAISTQEMLVPRIETPQKSKGSDLSTISALINPNDVNSGNLGSLNPTSKSMFPNTSEKPNSGNLGSLNPTSKSMFPNTTEKPFTPGSIPVDSPLLKDNVHSGPIIGNKSETLPGLKSIDGHGGPISHDVSGPLQQSPKNMPNSLSSPLTTSGIPTNVPNLDDQYMHDSLTPDNANGPVQQLLKNIPNAMLTPKTQGGSPRDILNTGEHDLYSNPSPEEIDASAQKLLNNMPMMLTPITPSGKSQNNSNPNTRDIQSNIIPGEMNEPLQKLLKNEPNSSLPPMVQTSLGKSPKSPTVIGSNATKDNGGPLAIPKTSESNKYPADIALPTQQLSLKNLKPENVDKLTTPSSDTVLKPPSSMFSLGSLWSTPSELTNESPDLNHKNSFSPTAPSNMKSLEGLPLTNLMNSQLSNPSVPGGLKSQKNNITPSSLDSAPSKPPKLLNNPAELIKNSALESSLPNSVLSQLLNKENLNPEGSSKKGGGKSDNTILPNNSPSRLLDAQSGLTSPNGNGISSPVDKIPNSSNEKKTIVDTKPTESANMLPKLLKQTPSSTSTPGDSSKNLIPEKKSSISKDLSTTSLPPSNSISPKLTDNVAEKSPYLPGTPYHSSPMMHKGGRDVPDHLADVPQSLKQSSNSKPDRNKTISLLGNTASSVSPKDSPQSMKQPNGTSTIPSIIGSPNSNTAQLNDPSTSPPTDLLKKNLNGTNPPKSPLTDPQKSPSDPSMPDISSLPNVLLAKKLLSENSPPGSVSSDEKLKELVDKLKSENHPSSGLPNSLASNPLATNSANPNTIQLKDPSKSSLANSSENKLNGTSSPELVLSDPQKSKSDVSVPDISSLPNVLLAKKLLSENLPPGSVPSDEKLKELVDKLKLGDHPSSGTPKSVCNSSSPLALSDPQKSKSDVSVPDISPLPDVLLAKKLLSENLPPGSVPSDEKLRELVDKLKLGDHPSSGTPKSVSNSSSPPVTNPATPSTIQLKDLSPSPYLDPHQSKLNGTSPPGLGLSDPQKSKSDPSVPDNSPLPDVLLAKKLLSENLPPGSVPSDEKLRELVDKLKLGDHPSSGTPKSVSNSSSPPVTNPAAPSTIQLKDLSPSSLLDPHPNNLNGTSPPGLGLSDPQKSKSDPSVPDNSSLPNMLLAKKLLSENSPPGSVSSDEKLRELVDKLKLENHPSSGLPNSLASSPSNDMVDHPMAGNPPVNPSDSSNKAGSEAPTDKYLEGLVDQLKSGDPSFDKLKSNGPSLNKLEPENYILPTSQRSKIGSVDGLAPGSQNSLQNPSPINSDPNNELIDKPTNEKASLMPNIPPTRDISTSSPQIKNATSSPIAPSEPFDNLVGRGSNGDTSGIPAKLPASLNDQLGNITQKNDSNSLPNLLDGHSLPPVNPPNTLISSMPDIKSIHADQNPSNPSPSAISPEKINNVTNIGTQGSLLNSLPVPSSSSVSPISKGLNSPTSTDLLHPDHILVGANPILENLPEQSSVSPPPNVGVFTPKKEIMPPNSSPTSQQLSSNKDMNPLPTSNITNSPTPSQNIINPSKDLQKTESNPSVASSSNGPFLVPQRNLNSPPGTPTDQSISSLPHPSASNLLPSTSGSNNSFASPIQKSTPGIDEQPKENVLGKHDMPSSEKEKDELKPSLKQMPLSSLSPILMPTDGNPFEALLTKPETPLTSSSSLSDKKLPSDDSNANQVPNGGIKNSQPSSFIDGANPSSSNTSMPFPKTGRSLDNEDSFPLDHLADEKNTPTIENSTPSSLLKQPDNDGLSSQKMEKTPLPLKANPKFTSLLDKLKNAGSKPQKNISNFSPQITNADGISSSPSQDQLVPTVVKPSISNDASIHAPEDSPVKTGPPLADSPSQDNTIKLPSSVPSVQPLSNLPSPLGNPQDSMIPQPAMLKDMNSASIPAPEVSLVKTGPPLADSPSQDNTIKLPSSVPTVKPLDNLPSLLGNPQDSMIPQPAMLKDDMNSVLPLGSKDVLPPNQPDFDHNKGLPMVSNSESMLSTPSSPPIQLENHQPSLNDGILDLKQPTSNPDAETKGEAEISPKVSSQGTPINLSPDLSNSVSSNKPMLPLPLVTKQKLQSISTPSVGNTPSQGQTPTRKSNDGSPVPFDQAPSDSPLLPLSPISDEALPFGSTSIIGSMPSPDQGSPRKLKDGSPSLLNPIPLNNSFLPLSPVGEQSSPSLNPQIGSTPSLGQTSTGSTPTIGNKPSLDLTAAGKSKDDSPAPLNPVPTDNPFMTPSIKSLSPGSTPSIENTPLLGQTPTMKSEDVAPTQTNSPSQKSSSNMPNPISITPVHPNSINDLSTLPTPLVSNNNQQLPNSTPGTPKSPNNPTVSPPLLSSTISKPSEDVAPTQTNSPSQKSPSNMPNPIPITPVHPDSINELSTLPTPLVSNNNQQLPDSTSGTPKSPNNSTVSPPLLSSPIPKPQNTTPPTSTVSNPVHSASPSHPTSPFDELDDSIPWLEDEVDISDDSMEFLHNRPKPSFKSSTKSPGVLPKQKPSNAIGNGSPTSVPPLPLQAPNLPAASPLETKDLSFISSAPKGSGLPSAISTEKHPIDQQNANKPTSSLDNPKPNSPSNLPGSASFSPQSNAPQNSQQQPITNTPSSLLSPPLSSIPDSAAGRMLSSGSPSPSNPLAAVGPSPQSPDQPQNSPLQAKNISPSVLGSGNPSSIKIKLPPGADNSSQSPSNTFNNPLSVPISAPLAPPLVSPPKPSISSNNLSTSEELPSNLHSDEHQNHNNVDLPKQPSITPGPSIPTNSPLQAKNISPSVLGLGNPSSIKIKLPPGADNSLQSPSNTFNNPSSVPISAPLAPPLLSPPKPSISSNNLSTSEELPSDLHSDEHQNHDNVDLPKQPSITPAPSIPPPVVTPPPGLKKPPTFNSLFTSEELPDELHSEEHPNSQELKPPPPSLIAPSPLSSPSTTPSPSSPSTTPPPGFKKPSLDLNKLFTSEELPEDLLSDEHHNPTPPAILPFAPSVQQITPPSPLFTKPFGMNNNLKSPSSPLIVPQINNNINKPSIFASFDDLPASPPSFNTFKAPMLSPPMANFDIPITLPKSAPPPSLSGPGTDDEANRKNAGQNWRQKLFQKKAFQPLS